MDLVYQPLMESKSSMSALVCYVCGDIASGRHYGVPSCEGCKGFFKRSIRIDPGYKCRALGSCEVTKVSRNQCQFCRFKKCLSVGMMRTSVQPQRLPNGCIASNPKINSQRRVNASCHTGDFPVNMIERKYSTWTPSFCSPDILPLSCYEFSVSGQIKEIWDKADVYNAASRLLRETVGWVRSIPLFQALSVHAQLELLEASWSELFAFGMIQNGALLPLENVRNAFLLQDMKQPYYPEEEHVNNIAQFLQSVLEIRLDDYEISLLKLRSLFSPDRLRKLHHPIEGEVKKMHPFVSATFVNYFWSQRPVANVIQQLTIANQLFNMDQIIMSMDHACIEAVFFNYTTTEGFSIIPTLLASSSSLEDTVANP